MNKLWRTVKFTIGWTITDADERSIAALPASAWTDSLQQDGTATDQAQAAELTGLNQRPDTRPSGLRLIARRTRPAARHRKKLTDLERKTGWRYAIVATNIGRIGRRARLTSPAVPRRAAPLARWGRRQSADEQGHGPAQPVLAVLDHQPGLDAGREHRRGPGRLDPAARPARPTRLRPRRTRHPALPAGPNYCRACLSPSRPSTTDFYEFRSGRQC
jgi:hypothetical protein